MSNTILVAYASRAGSTVGVAEAIGETLSAGGMQVEVRAMQDVTDLTLYRAVGLAAPFKEGNGCRMLCNSYRRTMRLWPANPSPRFWCA
jgi:menaquinone-dependent protoporphyrinogen IX oxidase